MIFFARVCLIDRLILFNTALNIIRQRDVQLPRVWINRHPLRAIHRGCAENIRSGTRINQYIRLSDKTIACSQAAFAQNQGQPFTCAVSIEFSDV